MPPLPIRPPPQGSSPSLSVMAVLAFFGTCFLVVAGWIRCLSSPSRRDHQRSRLRRRRRSAAKRVGFQEWYYRRQHAYSVSAPTTSQMEPAFTFSPSLRRGSAQSPLLTSPHTGGGYNTFAVTPPPPPPLSPSSSSSEEAATTLARPNSAPTLPAEKRLKPRPRRSMTMPPTISSSPSPYTRSKPRSSPLSVSRRESKKASRRKSPGSTGAHKEWTELGMGMPMPVGLGLGIGYDLPYHHQTQRGLDVVVEEVWTTPQR